MARPSTFVFLGLNAARALSIVALLLVFSSSILVMVTNIKAVNAFQANRIANATDVMLDCDYIEGSTVPNQPAGVFWAVVASLLIIFQVIILLLSEVRWPAVFFDRFFPVLGDDFGLGSLGIFQCLIGAQILSHHVDDFTLVSAFFLFSIGCLNILLGLVFREAAKTKRSLRAKRNGGNDKGIIGNNVDARPQFVNASPQFVKNIFNGNGTEDAKEIDFATWKSTDKATYGFGRQGEKAAGLKGFLIQRPEESLPRYASPTPTYAAQPPSRAPSTAARSHGGSRSHRDRRPSPARSASSRSSSSDSSRSSTYSHESSSSFASPMSYRETLTMTIPDRPETPPAMPFHASSPSKYGRNPGAF